MQNKPNLFNLSGLSKRELLHLLKSYMHAIDQSLISSIADTNGTIIHANKHFCNITKYSFDEIIGQNHRITNSNFHSMDFFTDMWNQISNGHIWQNEIKNIDKNGEFYWVDTVIMPIKNNNGKIILYLSIRIPIDEKKNAKEDKKEYSKSLEELLFMTSHKVRQPITHILGISNLMELEDNSLEDIKKMIGFIKQSARFLDDYTRELTTIIHELSMKHEVKSDKLKFPSYTFTETKEI